MVQWLGLHASTAGGMDSIPGQGTKILNASLQKKGFSRNASLNWDLRDSNYYVGRCYVNNVQAPFLC